MIRNFLEAFLIGFGFHFMNVPTVIEEVMTWDEFYSEEYDEALTQFDILFDSYEYKRSKNGRSMIRRENEKSYRFVSKG